MAFGAGRLQAGKAALMLRLAIIALFGWAAYRIVEENRAAPMLLPPPDDDIEDGDEPAPAARARKQRRRPA